MLFEYNPIRNAFSFERVRFDFEALTGQRFPEGKAGNVIRGALGWALREHDPAAYARYFEPRQTAPSGPSGFADSPRPFVLRAHLLDGLTLQPGDRFSFDLHLFRGTPAEPFARALRHTSLGNLIACERAEILVPLDNRHEGVRAVTVRFVTPTELKAGGTLAELPEFPVLFSRIRHRLSFLCDRELSLDFPAMARRAAGIALPAHSLVRDRRSRTSRKTGQTHPLGGFRGTALYRGDLDEFIPLLEAAHWTGVGRQTVWGKGAIELIDRELDNGNSGVCS
jgi:hypothetical protein